MNAGDRRPSREPDQQSDLEALDARLREARVPQRSDRASSRSKAEGTAWRLAVEMVSALAVCGFAGWWIDKWLGSSPWALLIGLLLGGATGLVNAFRVARAVQKAAEAADKHSGS